MRELATRLDLRAMHLNGWILNTHTSLQARLEDVDSNGKTPLALAIKKQKPDVEMFLRSQEPKSWGQQMVIVVEVLKRPLILWKMLQTGKVSSRHHL